MTANKQKVYSFEKAIETVEIIAEKNPDLVSDNTLQALYHSYEKLTEMFMTPDERRRNNFLLTVRSFSL